MSTSTANATATAADLEALLRDHVGISFLLRGRLLTALRAPSEATVAQLIEQNTHLVAPNLLPTLRRLAMRHSG